MRSVHSFPLFVAVAMAQADFDVPPLDTLSASARPFGQSLVNINASAVALDQAILDFQDVSDVGPLYTTSAAVITTVNQSTADIEPLPPFPDTMDGQLDAYSLVRFASSLAYIVNLTVFDLVSKKSVLVDTCVGTIVLQQVTATNESAVIYANTLLSKIPEAVLNVAVGIAGMITDALNSAVLEYADQTTTPASCTTTTTTTTSTSTSDTSTTPTSTTTTTTISGGSYPTGGTPPTSSSTPTGGSYPTGGSSPTGGSYPTGSSSPTGGSYPTGGSSPTGGSYPTGGSSPTAGPYPTGSSSPTGGSYPTGGANPTTASVYSPPAQSSATSRPSYPPSSPSGGNGGAGSSTTRSSPINTNYPGAAVPGFDARGGAVAVVAAAAAAIVLI